MLAKLELIFGSYDVGKTTLLNKESLNRHYHSTGVAKSKHTICIKTTAIVKPAGGLQWTYDLYLNKYLYSLTVPSSVSGKNTRNKLQNFVAQAFRRSPKPSPVPKDNTPNKSKDTKKAFKESKVGIDNPKSDLVTADIAKADSSKTPSLGDVWDIINFLDTGDQPEFVNILPVVSNSVALTCIVFNASKNLDSLVHVQHSVNGDLSFKPYCLDCTNLELIKYLMVSSENFNNNSTALLRLKGFHREDSQNHSKICYVGTHVPDVSKEEIQETDDQLSSIVLYFHFMEMLFYYHKVEGLCDLVFIDRQWLFEKLTELVEIKFTKGSNKKDVNTEDVELFTREGKLNININDNLKINLKGIQPLYFIHLLDHLNIIAPIDSKLKDYFMPCVLPCFLPESAEKFSNSDTFYGNIQQAPLLMGVRNGPMHHGFCHLFDELLRNLHRSWDSHLLSTSRMRHVYNSFITFLINSGHVVSLFYKIGYLEIQVRHKQSQPTFIHYNVGCGLDKALRKVSDHLKLNIKLLCYGFYCNCKKITHFAKLKDLTSPTEYIHCDYSNTELTENYRVWLQV